MIKAVTFDLDGVYFVNGKSNFILSLGKLGVSETEAKRVFLQSDQMNEEYKRGKMTDDEFWGWAASEWKLNMTPSQLINLLIEGYEVDESVVGVVRSIRRNGYKTLICSNNFSARVRGLQERFSFLDDFDAYTFSYEVGEVKPSKKIFEELVRKSGVNATEIVFADDNTANLAGANDVGINTFLYEGFDKFVEELKKIGVKI